MKTSRICIFLCCLVGLGVISCAKYQAGKGSLQEGRALEEQGNYVGALNNYEDMEDQNFGRISIHNLRYLYGDILDAMMELQENPNSPESHFVLGNAYYEKAQSVPVWPEIAPNSMFDSASYFSRQREQFNTQATAALQSATQLRPNYEDALFVQGKVYEDTEEPEKAIEIYQHLLGRKTEQPEVLSLEQKAEEPEVFSRLSILLYKQGQTEKGLELAKQAVTLSPDDPEFHFSLGQLYAEEGEDEQAITEFQETLCRDSSYVEGYYKIAQVYLGQGNFVDAERILLLGRVKNLESLRLSKFYTSLKTIMDDKELEEFTSIYRDLVGEVADRLLLEALEGRDFEASPALEIRYQRFKQRAVNRRRPYLLPCSGEKENPFYDRQIAKMQKTIDELAQSLESSEEESVSNKE